MIDCTSQAKASGTRLRSANAEWTAELALEGFKSLHDSCSFRTLQLQTHATTPIGTFHCCRCMLPGGCTAFPSEFAGTSTKAFVLLWSVSMAPAKRDAALKEVTNAAKEGPSQSQTSDASAIFQQRPGLVATFTRKKRLDQVLPAGYLQRCCLKQSCLPERPRLTKEK